MTHFWNLKKHIFMSLFLVAAFLCSSLFAADDDQDQWKKGVKISQKLQRLAEKGHWKELQEEAQKELDAMSPDDDWAGVYWEKLCIGLAHSNEIDLYDDLFTKYALGKFSQNVAFFAVPMNWGVIPRNGIMIDGKFKRGPNRGNAGRVASCSERDRVQVLALMAALIPKAEKELKHVHKQYFFNKLANLLLQGRNSGSSYKLQVLTDLSKLPDYSTEEGSVSTISRPPVNPDGTPVLYKLPSSWNEAANDGERFRFAIAKANNDEATAVWADFLYGQFDILAVERQYRREYTITPSMKQYLYNLKDNESIAELADGIRRITLPDDFNYIEIYKKLKRHFQLGQIYASRMQFEKAAEEFSKDPSYTGKEYAKQIRGSWGMLEYCRVAPAGIDFTVPYHFRNANKVTVNLYRVDMAKAVDRMLEQSRNPNRPRLSVWNLASRNTDLAKEWKDLIGEKPEVVRTFELHPLPHHWETTEYLKFGSLPPGAFVAEFVPDDNTNSLVTSMIWTADCALTAQNGAQDGKIRLFLNNPVNGKPVSGITLKIYSFYHTYGRNSQQERQKITPEVLTFTTDANGIAEFSSSVFKQPKDSSLSARYILAETTPSKLTLLSNHLFSYQSEDNMNEYWRTFMITDKPVYKPGDDIAFTGYLRQPSYSGNIPHYSGKTVTLVFHDPQGKEAFKKEVPFDSVTQSFTFETQLPADAMLGWWNVNVSNVQGWINFKVEEYKKPEYLLKVIPPSKPIKAGEKMPVTIEAKYYFGAPMTDAEVSYKVFREETVSRFPFFFAWNWLYGERYAVCTASYQNETVRNINYGRVMVINAKGKTDSQGKLSFEIDSADALAKFGDKDFRYTIEAEVKDSSNRVVSGTGSVIAAVKPFSVFIYTPWGFAKTGERKYVEIKAQTPNGEPVKGLGTLRIFRRALNKEGFPERYGAALKTISFVPNGPEKPELIMNEEGVYELMAEVVAEDGTAISKSVPFFVIGEKQGTELFGEYPISISTDKPTYQPGETAQILVSCNTPGRTVYFITRSERENKLECLTMDGFSKLFSIPIEKRDQPNFFVDVMSYQNGKMLTLQKQIIVPPEKKILNVDVKTTSDKAKPGTTHPLKITVTGLDGKPVSGNVTIAVYDKSLEAIQSSPIPEIRSFFWNWIRNGRQYFNTNLDISLPLHRGPTSMFRNIEISFGIPFRSEDGNRAFTYRGRRGMEFSGTVRWKFIEAPEAMSAKPTALGIAMSEAPAADGMALADMDMQVQENGIAEEQAETSANVIRTNFLDRAFWVGRITLPESGETTVDIPLPDNLTTWVIRAWSLTADTRVGEARSEIIVSKDLIARLELPRFMIQGDTVNAVVTINNTTDKDLGEVKTTLTAPDLINLPPKTSKSATAQLSSHQPWVHKSVHTQTVTLKANGTASYEVPLSPIEVGEYTLTLSASAGKEADALELKLPVLVKGIDKQINSCGRLDSAKTHAVITLDMPAQRRPETTAFALLLSPGAAKNMMELLPYLATDDSGDVFGVVNRFMPAMSAKLALKALGIKWEDAAPVKTARDSLYAEYMQRYSWNGNAVPSFKAEDFDRVVAESHRMIRKMVNSDGGWGWFGAYHEASWPDTTAYVMDALLDFNDKEDEDLIQNGLKWLEDYANRRLEDIRAHNWVSNTDALVARVLAKAGKPNKELMSLCYEHRVKSLAPYGYAMLALAYQKDSEEAKMLIRNLEQFLKIDDENGTAYLNIPSSCCFFWYGNENETLAAYLELLLRENPQNVTAQKVANYLVTNVRNSPWRNSTRALGAAVRALANYIVLSGEGKPDFTVTVRDGSEEHNYSFNAQNMWANDGPALFLPAKKLLKAGKRTIELEFSGTGALYWNGMLNYFSLEDKIEPAGLEMKIQRNYFRLVEDTEATALLAGKNGSAVKGNTLNYKRIPLKDGDTVKTGDLVEVELITTSKNDYDYVVIQDSMPAGFEFVTPVSGWMWNWAAPMYVEYKERGAKFYLRNMARGQSNAFYRIRAQLCGTVTALPAKGYGIYAPELKCNGSQQTLKTE